MRLTSEMLMSMTLGRGNLSNIQSIIKGLDQMGQAAELDRPHRLAHYIAQLMHESALFRYDRELWDGKGAQARYDTRTDLGNTPEVDGDGFKFRGRTPIQITGKDNYRQFRDWVWEFDRSAPDFVENPDAANTDPWEGYGPIWYWATRRLNAYADRNDIEMITRRINGGLNGYSDRLDQYTHAALVLLGYPADDVMAFQQSVMIKADGISGPVTRGKLHEALLALEASPVKQRPVARTEPAISDTLTAQPAQQTNEGRNHLWQSKMLRSAWAWLAANFAAAYAIWQRLSQDEQWMAFGLLAICLIAFVVINAERMRYWFDKGVR